MSRVGSMLSVLQRHGAGGTGGSLRGSAARGTPASESSDVELGSLLGPTLSSRVSDVYFPELMDEERAKCRALGLLHPDAIRYRIWQIGMLVLVAWSAVWVPFEFGFIPSPVPSIMYLDGAVDLAFLVDIALVFASARRCPKSLKLITAKQVIAKRYILGTFSLDLLSSIPYNLLSYWATGSPVGGATGAILRAVGCLRLHRLPQVYHEFSLLGRSSYGTFLAIRLTKLMLNIVLSAHYAAVLYFFLTTLESDPQSTWMVAALGSGWQTQPIGLQYVATMWWSIFTITSIGPAYIAATTVEQIFNCVYALFGMAALAYTLGTLTLLMVKASSSTMDYHEDMEALRSFAVRHSVTPAMEKQLREQLYLRLLQKKSETESFLANVPRHLRVAIMRQLHLPLVSNLVDFQGCSTSFLNQLVAACESEVVTRNAVVTMAGDVATHLYIVVSGKLVREDGPATAGERSLLLPGSVFGKTAVLCDVPQLFTVKALETSQLLRLSKQDFKAIMDAYKTDCAIILNRLKEKLESTSPDKADSSSSSATLKRSMSEEAIRVRATEVRHSFDIQSTQI